MEGPVGAGGHQVDGHRAVGIRGVHGWQSSPPAAANLGRQGATVTASGAYDEHAEAYARLVAEREAAGAAGDPFGILPVMLDLLGEVSGLRVLDAGCGTGYLARVLAARGAHVTGIDVAPHLIELARRRDPGGDIAYRVADLSRPVPGEAGAYDAIGSYLVVEDVDDYRGFADTLAGLLRSGGQLVLGLNNPYGAVVYGRLADYFATGAATPYRGLWAAGIHAHYHHRTLAEYLDAFLGCGLGLHRLVDVQAPRGDRTDGGLRFPRFMVLAFTRSASA